LEHSLTLFFNGWSIFFPFLEELFPLSVMGHLEMARGRILIVRHTDTHLQRATPALNVALDLLPEKQNLVLITNTYCLFSSFFFL
jgi:hypothetical protein